MGNLNLYKIFTFRIIAQFATDSGKIGEGGGSLKIGGRGACYVLARPGFVPFCGGVAGKFEARVGIIHISPPRHFA